MRSMLRVPGEGSALLLLMALLTAAPAAAQVFFPEVNGIFQTQINPGAGTDCTDPSQPADQLQVVVQLASTDPPGAFGLGTSTLMFFFNDAALRIPSTPAVNEALDPATDYAFIDPFIGDPGTLKFYGPSTVTVFQQANRLSVNLVLQVEGFGAPLPPVATPVVALFFDICDPAQTADLAWILPGAPTLLDPNPTEVFEDDNTTPVALGLFVNNGAALPVELAGFEAVADGQTALLSWATASETNNAGFEVQHRAPAGAPASASNGEAGAAWQVLGFVEGHGTTLETQHYQFRTGALAPGVHRFRLRQIDYDGTVEVHPEVEVAVALSVAYRLTAPYPNPVRGRARLGVMVARSQQVRVEVFDALGRRVAVLFEGALASGSSRSLSWDSGRVPSGLYVVRAVGETFTAARTLTVVQ